MSVRMTGGPVAGSVERRADAFGVGEVSFIGEMERDAVELSQAVSQAEGALAQLPERRGRGPDEQRAAEDLLATARRARRTFLTLHAEAVYDRLTERRTRRLRLPELVAAAADAYPGLVPSAQQMSVERALTQAERDGREIDQAIFVAGVLGSRSSGGHLVETMLMPTARAEELLHGFRAAGRVELSTVAVERRGVAAHVEFRNADRLNSEDERLIADLETAVDLALLDNEVRVGVLRGGPVNHRKYAGRRVFSAGINLTDLRNGRIGLVDFLLGRELGYVHKLLRGLLVRPEEAAWSERLVGKPWIGAVDAFAIGGGMQLLLVLDRVIAEEGAYLSLPAADEGIVPGLGNLRLGRLTGSRVARQVILGGRRIPVDSREGRLVCDEVVPAAELDARIESAVRELSAPGVAANRLMLALSDEPIDVFREYLAEFALLQAVRAYSPDVLARLESRLSRSREAR